MSSQHEDFWNNRVFAVVGNSAVKPFPVLTYKALKRRPDTTVYAVDPSTDTIEGDQAFSDLFDLPGAVDAVALEPPKEETEAWIERAAAAGIPDIWIHMGRETPEALALAADKGINACTGTCAVQYLDSSFPHNIHKFLRKLSGRW